MAAPQTRYVSGQWNVVCDWCGTHKKSSEVRKTWDGYYVCPEHWEPRQPLDFIKGVKDIQAVPFSRLDVNPTLPLLTANYTILATDNTVLGDATLGGFTFTLPAVPTVMEKHSIQKVDATSNVITIAGNGNTILGASTYLLNKPNSGIMVQFNVVWTIISTLPSES